MKQCLVNMFPKFLSILAGASCLMLAGCVPVQHTLSVNDGEKLPQQQVADFLSTDCMDVWSLHGDATEKNPLYWLRGMDCAERLSPEMARSEARLHDEHNWQDAFRRGILLSSTKITPLERREVVDRLDGFSPQIPSQVRPLYQVWRDGQASLLQLSDERSRYSKLQQSSDAELDILRQQQQHLRTQLDLTTRKLENLTDIERQLSSRKPAPGNFTPDAGHAADPASATKDEPAAEDKP